MLFIYLAISISSAEIYQKICQEGQILNLYNNQCIEFKQCNTNCIVYNTTGYSCSDSTCPHHKLYLRSPGVFESYENLNSEERCTFSGFQDMESCQELINSWSNNYYNRMNQINCQECAMQSDFLSYTQSFDRSYEVAIDTNVPGQYKFSSILTFILARFNESGSFLGFKEVTTDLNHCGERNDIAQVWRQFGTNFYSDCNFNLVIMDETRPNEYYDLYLLNQNGGEPELMMVPVLIRNHGRNDLSDSANYELYRRFFIKHSTESEIQYAQNITIQIQIDSSNTRQIKVPLLVIQYSRTSISDYDISSFSNVNFEKRSSVIRDFHFSVVYLRSLDSFWRQCLIVLIIFLLLAAIIWVVRCVIYAKYHKEDGTTIAFFFAAFCETFGSALTIITFFVTFFLIFIFFKFQKEGYMCLPPEREFWYVSIVVWASFVLMLTSSIIRLVLQSRANVCILDWETPQERGVPVSAWRRLMIANEYNRILSTRSYSMNFTLVFLVFILEGFNYTLLSSPIPRTELIDVGKTYKVLHFGFTTFLWLILMIVESILNFILVKRIGDPYLNFIDLCATANCSVLIMNTKSQGFYIHGRSNHDHTDVAMGDLIQNMINESKGNVGLRGLIAGTDDQVFHVYLENGFADVLSSAPELILDKFARKAMLKPQKLNSKTIKEVEELEVYNYLNKSLCSFFAAEESPYTYSVQKSTIPEKILGWGPQVGKESVLTIQNDYSYRQSLFQGVEWTLNIMYLLLFAGIEMETRSPAIAAFIVFIVDLIFMASYSRSARINFARKAILDVHYIIS